MGVVWLAILQCLPLRDFRCCPGPSPKAKPMAAQDQRMLQVCQRQLPRLEKELTQVEDVLQQKVTKVVALGECMSNMDSILAGLHHGVCSLGAQARHLRFLYTPIHVVAHVAG